VKKKQNNLEKIANKINMDLRRDGKALILKIPVPILLTSKGLVAKASTVDYSGTLLGGLSIDYDAKETKIKTSFPLANIEEHQFIYLKFKYDLGGIAFFLIHFTEVYKDLMFITPIPFIEKYWQDAKTGGRKSIPLLDFNKKWLTSIENYLTKIEEVKDELRNPKFT